MNSNRACINSSDQPMQARDLDSTVSTLENSDLINLLALIQNYDFAHSTLESGINVALRLLVF